MDPVKRFWYLSPVRAAKVQASLGIRAVSPEPPLLAHISSESRGTFRQKARSLASLNGWACAVEICHDGMLEDTNSLDAAHIMKSLMLIPLTAIFFFNVCDLIIFISWESLFMPYEPRHEKICVCHMRSTKTHISVHICEVWSVPLLFAA